MKIIQQNENRLVFMVYPDKVFTIVFIIIILFGSLSFIFTPENSVENWFFLVASVIIAIHVAISFLIPTYVTIDKTTNKLIYKDFSIFPSFIKQTPRDLPIYRYNPYTTVAIDQLREIQIRKTWGDIVKPTLVNLIYEVDGSELNLAICFVLKDQSYKYILPGFLSYRRHRTAAVKIADYLNIPFTDLSDK